MYDIYSDMCVCVDARKLGDRILTGSHWFGAAIYIVQASKIIASRERESRIFQRTHEFSMSTVGILYIRLLSISSLIVAALLYSFFYFTQKNIKLSHRFFVSL